MKKTLALCAATASLSGCLTTIPEQPDLSGHFDGAWVLKLTMDREYQMSGTREFHCPRVKDREALLYIQDGRAGTLEFGFGQGLVDGQGNLYLRQKVGHFNFRGEINPDRDLVVEGQLTEQEGHGRYIHAVHGSTQGCLGNFVAQRRDVIDYLYARSDTFAFPVTLERGGQRSEATLWTAPLGNHLSSLIAVDLGDGQQPCQGYWTKASKSATEGRWSLFCGHDERMQGSLKFLGSQLTAEGSDNAAQSVRLAGDTRDRKLKHYPKPPPAPGEEDARSQIVTCRLGSKDPFQTSAYACDRAHGTRVDPENEALWSLDSLPQYVYSKPSTSNHVVGTIASADGLVVLSRQEDWAFIRQPSSGTTGWIRTTRLRKSGQP